jgi:organic radical activating enzyme
MKMNNQYYTIDYPKKEINLYGIEWHITDKCNLNCAGCSHYCPLVKEDKSDSVNAIRQSLRSLYNKGVRWYYLCLIGGEPTLNIPKMIETINMIRTDFFWTRHIYINTNGSLLTKLPAEFLKLCAEKPKMLGGDKQDVSLLISEYPGIPEEIYEKGYQRLKDFGVSYEVQACRDGMINWQLTPDLNNPAKYKNTLTDCDNLCTHLRHNKLYFCATVAYADEWNEAFPKHNIATYSQNKVKYPDYLEIDDKLTFERIAQYFTSGMGTNFCNHCKQLGEKTFDWHVSKKSPYEWMYQKEE